MLVASHHGGLEVQSIHTAIIAPSATASKHITGDWSPSKMHAGCVILLTEDGTDMYKSNLLIVA